METTNWIHKVTDDLVNDAVRSRIPGQPIRLMKFKTVAHAVSECAMRVMLYGRQDFLMEDIYEALKRGNDAL